MGSPSNNRRLKHLVTDLTLDNQALTAVVAKKSLRPAVFREAAGLLTTLLGMTERRACRVLGFDRSTCRYRSRRASVPPTLLASLHRHASEWTQMGYHTCTGWFARMASS
jgi:hypothetical protein